MWWALEVNILLLLLFRDFALFAAESGQGSSAAHIMEQWTASGLTEIRLVNYTVLLSLPDTDQNKIILTNSSQCFYPSGQQCSTLPSAPLGRKEKNDLLYSYAAYSAKGSLEVMKVLETNSACHLRLFHLLGKIRIAPNILTRLFVLHSGAALSYFAVQSCTSIISQPLWAIQFVVPGNSLNSIHIIPKIHLENLLSAIKINGIHWNLVIICRAK